MERPLSTTTQKLWYATSLAELNDIQETLVHQLHVDPYDALVHYHLCLYYLKRYAITVEHSVINRNMPLHAGYLNKALQMAQQTELLDDSLYNKKHKHLGVLALGYISFTIGEFDDAQKIAALLSQSPLYRESYFLKSSLLASKPEHNISQNLDFLKEISTDPVMDTKMFLFLASPLMITANTAQHLQLIAHLKDSPHHAAATFLLAKAFLRLNQHSAARATLKRAFKAGLQSRKAQLAYIAITLPDDPYQALNTLSSMDSDDDPDINQVLKLKGLAWQHLSQSDKANSYLLQSLKHITQNQPHRAQKALESLYTYHQNHDMKQGMISLLHLLTQQLPQLTTSHFMLGSLYLQLQPHKKDAINHLNDALALDPDNALTYAHLGLAYYHLKSYTQAKKAFFAATQLNPKNAINHYNVACIHAILGESQLAIHKLKEALKLNPKLKEMAFKDQDLKSLHQDNDFKSLMLAAP